MIYILNTSEYMMNVAKECTSKRLGHFQTPFAFATPQACDILCHCDLFAVAPVVPGIGPGVQRVTAFDVSEDTKILPFSDGVGP